MYNQIMLSVPTLKIKCFHENIRIPTKAHPTDAGYDLYAPKSGSIPSGQQACIPLGISVTVPSGTYGRIAPRSSLALKAGIDVMAGVIDETYDGELKIILRNHGNEVFKYEKGNKIGQLIITKIEHCPIDIVNELNVDSRGGGFGSTGD